MQEAAAQKGKEGDDENLVNLELRDFNHLMTLELGPLNLTRACAGKVELIVIVLYVPGSQLKHQRIHVRMVELEKYITKKRSVLLMMVLILETEYLVIV